MSAVLLNHWLWGVKRLRPKVSISLLLIFVLAFPSFGAQFARTLADGVTLVQDINSGPDAPVVVNLLRINPKTPGLRLCSTLAKDRVVAEDATGGRETVSSMVARKGALAGINADYFGATGDPLGLAIIGGELVSEPMDRAALGITASGEILLDKLSFDGTVTTSSGASAKLHGLNRARGKNELVLFTPIFGASTGTKDGIELPLVLDGPIRACADMAATATADPSGAVGSQVPKDGAVLCAHGTSADWLIENVHKGDRLTIRLDIKAESGRSWEKVVEAVGGGPWLLRGGEVYIDRAEERLPVGFDTNRHPRTAAGVTAAGELLLVTVDGRQAISRGMTLPELAALMKSFGAVDAINLDGGGSSSLSIRGLVINSPSEGVERAVADALLLYVPSVPQAGPPVKFAEPGPVVAASGEGRMLALIDETTGSPVSDQAGDAILWGTTGGIGFVNQKGYFVPVKVGKGAVVALSGGCRIELPVTVVPGPPVKLTAKIVPDPTGAPNRGQVEVKLADLNGNGIAGKIVTLTATGGVPDSTSATTDEKGAAAFGITWDSTAAAAKVTVSAAGMTAEVR